MSENVKTSEKPSVTAEKSQDSGSLLTQRDNAGTNHAKFTGHTPDFNYKENAETCDAIREMLKGFAGIGNLNSVDAYNLALAGAEVQRNRPLFAAAPELLEACKEAAKETTTNARLQ